MPEDFHKVIEKNESYPPQEMDSTTEVPNTPPEQVQDKDSTEPQ